MYPLKTDDVVNADVNAEVDAEVETAEGLTVVQVTHITIILYNNNLILQ